MDHVILTVSDFKHSAPFYAEALKPLGITTLLDYEGKDGHPDLKGFGMAKAIFSGSKKGSPTERPPPRQNTRFFDKLRLFPSRSFFPLWRCLDGCLRL